MTQWSKDQWIQGAVATAAPGWQGARRILTEPIRNRVFFAGEAAHETAWGTVGGAWESGTRTAEAVVRRITGQPEPRPEGETRRRSRRARAGNRSARLKRYAPSRSFSQPTIVLAISSGC